MPPNTLPEQGSLEESTHSARCGRHVCGRIGFWGCGDVEPGINKLESFAGVEDRDVHKEKDLRHDDGTGDLEKRNSLLCSLIMTRAAVFP